MADGETVPETIEWTVNIPKGKVKGFKVNKNVKTNVKDGKVIVTLPKGLKNEPIAMQFKIKK